MIIGIDDSSFKNIKTTIGYLEKDEYKRNLPPKKNNEHKENIKE